MNTTAKGSRWRLAVQRWLPGHIDYVRPWTDPGDDIGATVGTLRLSVECKDQRKLDLAGWVDQAEANAGNRIPVVFAHRLGHTDVDSAYVILSGRAFRRLVEP